MSQDAPTTAVPAVQPRKIPSSDEISITSTPTPTVLALAQSVSGTALLANASLVTQAAFSTVTSSVELDGDICTAALPAGGYIEFSESYALYLNESVSFIAPCSNQSIFSNNSTGNSTVLSDDPFYSSTSPQVFALATATVISYVLVILIFITPRTFHVGGPATSSGSSGSGSGLRSLFPGTGGRNSSVIGIGRRPLLQKIAALTVAISLTIATADTFRVAEEQYNSGYQESKKLVAEVVNSPEIRITRVISDTFLWLAQVQTLIRLFPRHKEKVTIKWLGFALVLCDTIFSILENFVSQVSKTRPGTFTDAIPALSYLFELSIGLIYASCVLYYALSKRRFAFWHAKMRNVCLVALLSVIAVLIPVVFFITDLAQPDIAAWGEYIRWVGAAAASVVVWEWVERIEALERDEKKDGILGREVFDGDEMLDLTPDEDGYGQNQQSRPGNAAATKKSAMWKNVRELNIDLQPKFLLRNRHKGKEQDNAEKTVTIVEEGTGKSDGNQITRPPQAITPISRSDTNSAASTVYAVRYHDPFSPSPAIPEDRVVHERRQSVQINVPPAISDESTLTNSTSTTMDNNMQTEQKHAESAARQIWQGVANPFKRKRTEPPAEVAAQIAESNARRSPIDGHLNLRSRFNAFTSAQRSKFGGRSRKSRTPLAVTFIPSQPRTKQTNADADDAEAELKAESEVSRRSSESSSDTTSPPASPQLADLPVTVIPPPVRGARTWSPEDLDQVEQANSPPRANTTSSFQFSHHPTEFQAGSRQPSLNPSPRGFPPTSTSVSPGRLGDNNTPSNAASSILRRSRNNRSATLDSISDRLSSASPAATSNSPVPPRSATTDSAGAPRPNTLNNTRPHDALDGA